MRRTVLIKDGENCFQQRGVYSSKGSSVRKKKEIRKFCKKLSMNVNLPVEYNAEKYDLNYKSHIYNTKTMTQSYKPVNSKPIYTFPD